MYSPLLDRLIEALRCLPGVGPKTAQRMAFHLLDRDRDGGRHLAATLLEAMNRSESEGISMEDVREKLGI